ncbi:hypothetical protein LAY57_10015 [Argonema antarcticum A004/B2]|nr:hypothetical protein [Argonema antarcticum A004/B2]
MAFVSYAIALGLKNRKGRAIELFSQLTFTHFNYSKNLVIIIVFDI